MQRALEIHDVSSKENVLIKQRSELSFRSVYSSQRAGRAMCLSGVRVLLKGLVELCV